MRVAILWKQMSGYAHASFAALQAAGVDLFLAYRAATREAPFDDEMLDLGIDTHGWSERPDEALLQSKLRQFAPDAMLVISWDVGAYRRIARTMSGQTLRVLCMDNAWLGTPKQWGGRASAPVIIRPTYDVAFLPGERQAAFARRLGFADEDILWGLYTCDQPAFAAVHRAREPDPPRAFAFVGRLVDTKGADVLAEAYTIYRRDTDEPWPLIVCGTGPMARRLAHLQGVEMLGFVQPAELPAVFARSGCLVAPSTFEPWGVVIHEAASAGLAVVCSTACGASTRLVLDGYNGAVVPAGNPSRLAEAMTAVAAGGVDRAEMSRRSAELSTQFTPDRWAAYLVERLPRLRARFGLHE